MKVFGFWLIACIVVFPHTERARNRRGDTLEKFIPVKVTDKKWAECLLDGEVFMRPLHQFGSWNKNKDRSVANQFRGDIHEGTAAVYGDIMQFPGIGGFPQDLQNVVRQVSLIDDGDIQFFKIFSLYRMIYNSATDFFVKPDPRMKQFGDTAVIIQDYNEFIERFGLALFSKYNKVISMICPVDFYGLQETKQTNPLFSKEKSYEYQNELRMAFCELEHNKFAIGPGTDTALSIVPSLDPVTLQIGSIRDIAIVLPIDDFLNLKFPQDIRLRFPMRDPMEEPSNYDGIVQWTKEQMKDYHTIFAKTMFSI